ncbi:MAG: hypothetical protein NDI61_08710 [Bdellovibrionaceae bacterium]|nr:hypothetical protein [Pseudobdellovibrionaceae bacterium]
MVKRVLSIVLALLQTEIAMAQIAIRPLQLPRPQFRAVLALHPELRAWSEADVDAASSELAAAKTRLNRALERAQRTYLDGSLSDARQQFIEIGDLAYESDWPTIQRRAIHYALLRAAQLSEDLTAQKSLLERAVSLDPEFKPDATLFPPPLLLALHSVRGELQARSIEVRVRERFANFDILKLNGRIYRVSETPSVRILPGQHRLHLRSDALHPVTERMSAAKLLVYSPPEVPFVSGTCDHPEWAAAANSAARSSLGLDIAVVAYSTNCLWKNSRGTWARFDPGSGQKIELASPLLHPPRIPTNLELHDFAEPPQPFYKRSWFWIGLSGLAITSAVLIKNRTDRKSTPTSPVVTPSQTSGF